MSLEQVPAVEVDGDVKGVHCAWKRAAWCQSCFLRKNISTERTPQT